MKRIFPIGLAVLTLVAVAAVAVAQSAPTPGGFPNRGGFAIRMVEHRLGVTAAQREEAKAILKAEQPRIEQLHASIKAERAEMDASGSFNESQVRGIAAKYAQTNTNLLVERAKLRSELLAILTPEQRGKLEQIRTQFSAVMDQRLETLGDQL